MLFHDPLLAEKERERERERDKYFYFCESQSSSEEKSLKRFLGARAGIHKTSCNKLKFNFMLGT
jgi:hypothetical protein